MVMELFQFGGFEAILNSLEGMGFFLYLFPFLLALAIVYGVLSFALKAQLPNSARALVSIIIAFFVMLYSSWNTAVVAFFGQLSGLGLIIGSVILFLVILLGLFGLKPESITGGEKGRWIAILVIVVLIILIAASAGIGSFISIPSWASSADFLAVVFFIVILALVFFWMKSEDSGAAAGGDEGEKN